MDRIASLFALTLALMLPIHAAAEDRVAPLSAPTIVLTSPPANAFIAEALTPSVLLSASVASADYPIAHVVFYMCETRSATCYSSSDVVADIAVPPYEYRWTPPRLPSQVPITRTYQTWATAVNSAGQAQTSSFVPFTVLQPPPPPSINLVVPKQESGYVSPSAPVLYATAAAGDTLPPSTIARVDFLDESTVIGSVTGPNSVPEGYAFIWQNAPHGIHLVSARATDSLGYSTTSKQVTLYVVDPDPPPHVALTSPATGQIYVSPNSVPLAATAMSTTGVIQRVEFVTSDLLIGTSFSPPFALNWSNPPPGTFAVVAKAYDDIGIAAASPAAYIQVLQSARLPAVVLTAPAPGASVASGSPVAMAATAVAPDGSIGRVDFFADTTLVGSAATPPFVFTWSNPAAGPQSLLAKAVDLQGNVGTSAAVAIQVVNNRNPDVTLTSPASGSQFMAPASISLAAIATDVDGSVAKVEFFAGSNRVAVAASAPFTATWSNVGVGNYALTAVATDNLGATTTSATASVSVSVVPPSVSLNAPQSGATYAPGQAIVLTAAASAPQRSISRVEFYSDGTLIGATQVTGGPSASDFSLTWTGATAGPHALTTKVFTTDGANDVSQIVNITVYDLAVTLTEPVLGQVYLTPAEIRITANPTETGARIARVDFYGDGALVGSVNGAPYTVTWNGVAVGAHSIRARAIDSLELAADSPTVAVSVQEMGLSILSPAPPADAPPGASASVASDFVLVRGTYAGVANTGITVNGVVAETNGAGQFALNGLPIALGQNTIDVVLTTIDGRTTQKTIPVSSTARASFRITALPEVGFAPLSVRLSARSRGVGPAKTIQVANLDGGAFDAAAFDGETLGTITYSTPGFYLPTIAVTYSSGQTYTQTVAIVVRDVEAMDRMYVGMFNQFIGALQIRNTAAAVQLFAEPNRAKYGAAFDALRANLPEVAQSFKGFGGTTFSRDIAEYALKRSIGGKTKIYLLDFLRDGDGVWRFDSM